MTLRALLAVLLVVGGCGSEQQNPVRGMLVGALVNATRKPVQQQGVTVKDLRAQLTPELLEKVGAPVLIAELPRLRMAAVLFQVQQNGPYTTWLTQDGVGVNTRSGMITGTRGLGFDLMSADVVGALSIITEQDRQSAQRSYKYLDGEDQEKIWHYTCQYVRNASRVTEYCDRVGSTSATITNLYWLDRQGEIWRSRQWVNAQVGYMNLERPD